MHDDPKEENKPPYRYWFWVKGNKLRSSGIHWSTDGFVATTKPLTGSYNTNQYENRVNISRLEASGGKFIKSKGRDLTINGAKWGISFYVIDLKPWYDKKYCTSLLMEYSGRVYLHTIASNNINDADEKRLAGPFRTLASWHVLQPRLRSFAASGMDDYKGGFNAGTSYQQDY